MTTCLGNDYAFDSVFSRTVTALLKPVDVVVGVSTSGTSPSVVEGLAAARHNRALTVLLTGEKAAATDIADPVASPATARIQEGHVLLHLLSELTDRQAVGQ